MDAVRNWDAVLGWDADQLEAVMGLPPGQTGEELVRRDRGIDVVVIPGVADEQLQIQQYADDTIVCVFNGFHAAGSCDTTPNLQDTRFHPCSCDYPPNPWETQGVQYEGGAVLGPIVVQEAATDVVPESHGTLKADPRAAGASEAQLMAGVVAVVGLVCMIVLGTVLVWRRYKPIAL
ncbi:hypothetical protein SKAU_G00012520 [Synaphobranchus kaupii]|uniref:Uncharacterized protein n=1 Tax=Synaphobranchus kaupii TaxID=118154 RepID=A0A9Q1JDN4_SYNKA|nr:hypothetical protein SKAU_G00012520 [Synaphobranchus kaupii]